MADSSCSDFSSFCMRSGTVLALSSPSRLLPRMYSNRLRRDSSSANVNRTASSYSSMASSMRRETGICAMLTKRVPSGYRR